MAQLEIDPPSLNFIGNSLAGLAAAFVVDRIAMGGAVAGFLPDIVVNSTAFVIFAGVTFYGYKQVKRLN